MKNSKKEFLIISERFLQSPPKYRMKIVLPQLLESIENLNKSRMINEEGIMDTIGSWFGGTGMNTLWERIIDGILDGMGLEEGFLRDTISVVLSNAKWHEIPGILTNCNKFSDLVVTQLPEIITKYVMRQFVDEDVLTVALRKTIIDTLATTEFAQSMKGTVTSVVCEAMGWVGGIFSGGKLSDKEMSKYNENLPEFSRNKKREPKVY
jgi:hypothetical protein